MGAVLTVLDKLMIMFMLLVTGYVCRKKQVLSNEFMDGISGFLTKIVIPCFMIDALQIDFTAQLFHDGMVVFVTCIIMHLMGFVVGLLSAKAFSLSKSAKGIWIFSCMFANIGFMGVPVIALIFGGNSVFYCAFASFAFNITAYTLGVVILNGCSEKEDKKAIDFAGLLKAPVNSMTILGLILFVFRIKLPSFIGDSMEMVGSMLSPLAMMYVGTVLGKLSFKEAITEKWAYVLSVFRLVVMPLLAYLILKHFIHDTLILGVIIIGLSTPVGALCAIIAAEYDADVELASKYIFTTTVLCIFTMPMFFLLFL
ncbi:AEC family transporter [Chakrabartyella piscis]|uniref:AEC family transporter n=1 Tax=Chakrabartyella piscis TaxID=2918914 RepID=UPI002958771E|nr:AEC family transporter [Chakrabartyella piscis]